MSEKTPILYDQMVEVRFSDLDQYGHVTAPKYLELIVASRFLFLSEKFGLSAADCTAKGAAWFMIKSEVEYLKAIGDVGHVFVTSHVSRLEGVKLDVTFEIRSKDQKVLHSKGKLHFLIIDLKTGKTAPLPEWAHAVFFQ